MNKIKLLEMLKQLIALQKQEKLTLESFQEVEKNTELTSPSNDLVSYKEAELICFLFQEMPYYHILNLLNKLCMNLAIIATNDTKAKTTISLINAYLSDLLKNITARVETEVNIHIAWLIQNYYQNDSLDPNRTIQALTKNSVNPKNLAGMFVADSIHYEQAFIPGFESQKEELREKISKVNYRKRSSIENTVQKLVNKFFNESSFEQFLVALRNCLAYYKKENVNDCEILEDEIMIQLKNFYQKAKKSWQEQSQPKEEGYQFKLEYFTT